MRTFVVMVAALALAGLTRADDPDPEPPGGKAGVRKLQGKWVSVRQILGGKEKAFAGRFTYAFAGDRAEYSSTGGRTKVQLKFEADRKQLNAFRVTTSSKFTNRYFFKFEKGELHLTIDRSGDPNAKADFSGKRMPVTVYKKQK